jgi:ABC-type uncharacterized transport system involved in gliding motility auxiliary subunit
MKRFLSKLNVLAALVFALVVVLMVNYIAAQNAVRSDWSSRRFYQLSEKTVKLLEQLDQKVNVVVFFQPEHQLFSDVENLLKEYAYHSKALRIRWVDPMRDMAETERLALQYKLTKANVVVFEVGDRSTVVSQDELADYSTKEGRKDPVMSAFKGEQAFSSAIMGVLQESRPSVYFLVGHGERRVLGEHSFDQITGYSKIAKVIEHDNLTVKELLLDNREKIPDDAAAIVIAGPSKRMNPEEVQIVDDYLSRSGRVLVLLDAMKESGLEQMLFRWGVQLRDDFVLDPENTLNGSDVYIREYYDHPITKSMGDVGARFHLPRSIEPVVGVKQGEDRPIVMPLARSSAASWSETQLDQPTARYDEDSMDLKGSHTLAVAVERGASKVQLDVQIKPSRMVVFGDSDFVSNAALTGGDQDLFMSALNWLLDREVLMAIAPKPIEDIKLNLTRRQLTKLFWINVGAIPSVAILIGLFIWWRRRK